MQKHPQQIWPKIGQKVHHAEFVQTEKDMIYSKMHFPHNGRNKKTLESTTQNGIYLHRMHYTEDTCLSGPPCHVFWKIW